MYSHCFVLICTDRRAASVHPVTVNNLIFFVCFVLYTLATNCVSALNIRSFYAGSMYRFISTINVMVYWVHLSGIFSVKVLKFEKRMRETVLCTVLYLITVFRHCNPNSVSTGCLLWLPLPLPKGGHCVVCAVYKMVSRSFTILKWQVV